MEAMSAFKDSTEFVNNRTELRRRLDDDSYSFIRGLLPKEHHFEYSEPDARKGSTRLIAKFNLCDGGRHG